MDFDRADRPCHNPMEFASLAYQIYISNRQVSALFPPPEQNCIRMCDWLREIPSSLFSFRLLGGVDGNAEQKDEQ